MDSRDGPKDGEFDKKGADSRKVIRAPMRRSTVPTARSDSAFGLRGSMQAHCAQPDTTAMYQPDRKRAISFSSMCACMPKRGYGKGDAFSE
jgi:hypothetical protein